MNKVSPVKILGVNVYPYTNMSDLTEVVNKKIPLFSVNAEILLYSDEHFKQVLNSGIGYPDGIGAVLALKKKGVTDAIKIPGCELWLKIIEKYYKSDCSFYLIGSTDSVIEATVKKLNQIYTGINIIGHRNGFLDKKDIDVLKEDLMIKKPDIVFVAMGFPKQEFLVEELYSCHKATYLPLGGSFDVFTGNVKRAPKWWIDHKLEFAYRLIKQPSRIKRQLPLLKFIYRLIFNKL